MLLDEGRLVDHRQARERAHLAALTQQAVAGVMSKKANRAFQKTLDKIENG